jgi:acetyl-CoA synthetase (ADP-forming)
MPLLKGFFKAKGASKSMPTHKVKTVKKAAKPVKKAVIRPKAKHAKKAIKKTMPEKAKPMVKALPKLPPVNKMDDIKAFELVRGARIPLAPYFFCKNEKDLPVAVKKVGFPCVAKVCSKAIVHKTEVGGIIKDIRTPEEASAAFKRLMGIKNAEYIIFQKQMEGLELIIGAKSDPQFGHIISVGLGGIYVEVLKDVTFRIAPLAEQDAMQMVAELKGIDILKGARGQKPINLLALYDVLIKLGKLATTEKLKEVDINPLFCSSEGCWAADVRIILP